MIRARLPLEAGSGIEPLYEDLQSRRLRFSEHLEQLFCQEFQLRKRYLRIPNHPCRSRVFFAGLRRNYTGTGRAPVVDGVHICSRGYRVQAAFGSAHHWKPSGFTASPSAIRGEPMIGDTALIIENEMCSGRSHAEADATGGASSTYRAGGHRC